MREIKFRAWDKADLCMCNVLEMRFDNEELIKVGYTFDGSDDIEKACLRYPSQLGLMQYTGLKDKNGKEIYEGDVIRGNEKTDGYGNGFMYQAVVEWDSEQGRWIAKEEDETWSLYDFDFEEIIGNVYESPELIQTT